jgi:hypothetical protein
MQSREEQAVPTIIWLIWFRAHCPGPRDIPLHYEPIIRYERYAFYLSFGRLTLEKLERRCIVFVRVVPMEESFFPRSEDINGYFHLTIVPTLPSLNKNNKRKAEPSQISCLAFVWVIDGCCCNHTVYTFIIQTWRFKNEIIFFIKTILKHAM